MEAPQLYAVLLSGGTGTRFWPASRRQRPKQYLRIVGERSMLAETCARLEGLVPLERVLVVTTADQRDEVLAALPALAPANVVIEPEGRNTAPCIALATQEVRRRDPHAIVAVLPADHVIRPREAFQRSLVAAARAAALEPSIFVFGIHPSFPATSFGWIRAGAVEDIVDGIAVHVVERFVEKPDLARARKFLEQGGHYWNSGMFVASVDGLARAFREHLPQVWSALEAPLAPAALAQAYSQLPSVSLDVGVLERERRVRMLPIDYFWSDVGSWDALATVHAPDETGNLAAGGAQLVATDSAGNIVHGEDGALVALVGVDDLIVVHSGAITLVCRRDRAQDVKLIVERLRTQGPQFL